MFVIRLNGSPYANFTTRLRNPEKVVAAYKLHIENLGYKVPVGLWSANQYVRNSFDKWGN